MSDDLRIPAMGLPGGGRAPLASGSSYRARLSRGDPGMRWAMIAAAGLGGVLFVAMAGYAVMGRRPATVPVIEADSRPIRVKPENAGGMQFAGADELGGDAVPGSEKMAPAAETPAPQALRAQMQQAAPATEAPSASPASAAGPAPVTAATAGVPAAPGGSPLPDTPPRPDIGARPGNAPPATRAATPAATPKPAAAGGLTVQLGALSSEAAAMAEWQKLAKGAPDVFASHHPAVQKTERDGKTFWRLRTTGFADMADATSFCTKVRAKGGACTIASF